MATRSGVAGKLSQYTLTPPEGVFGLVAMYLAIPTATAIAIVRSRLFDVDQLLIRGAVYAGFAVLLVAALRLDSGLAGWWLGRDSVRL